MLTVMIARRKGRRIRLAAVSILALTCLVVIPGCGGGSRPAPTAEDTKYTQDVIDNPMMGMPGTMGQGGSPDEQLQRAAPGATPNTATSGTVTP